MLTLTISQADIELLRYERYAYPCILVRKRLFALYLKATRKYSHGEIAEIVGVSINSITTYIKVWNAEGYEGIIKCSYGTNRSDLENHRESILTHFEKHPPHTINEAIEQVCQLTGVRRSPTQMRAWMKRHGLKHRKTGQIPSKADSEKQGEFLENTLEPLIEQAQGGKVHLLFMDAAHLVMGVFLCCLWSVKRVFVKSSAGRKRHNVLGAVDAMTQQIHFLTNQTYINAESIVAFFEQVRTHYTDGLPIHIVLDNARYQKCELVRLAAARLNIHLVYLPAYSPNLNIIERLWKWLKKKCLYAKYYEDFELFKKAINETLENAPVKHQQDLKSLLSLKFQRF